MVLVLALEGLRMLEMEGVLVLQEFVNHGGVVHKVYVAGSKVCRRVCLAYPHIFVPREALLSLVSAIKASVAAGILGYTQRS